LTPCGFVIKENWSILVIPGENTSPQIQMTKNEKWWKVPKDAVGFIINHIAKYNLQMKGV
jgi:hypothetical protein